MLLLADKQNNVTVTDLSVPSDTKRLVASVKPERKVSRRL